MAKKKDPKNEQKSNAPGTEGAAKAWNEAAAQASATKGEQLKIVAPVDVEVGYEEIEVPDPLTDAEAELLGMQAMRDLAKADRLKKLIADITKQPKKDLADALKAASKAAKEADERCRVIKMRCRVERDYRVLTVRTIREDTGQKALPDRAMTAKEVEDRATAAPDDIPEHAAPDDEPEETADAGE